MSGSPWFVASLSLQQPNGPTSMRRVSREGSRQGCTRLTVGRGRTRTGRRPGAIRAGADVASIVVSTDDERDGLLLEPGRELMRIRRILRRAHRGHGGGLVVEGPAGIGKTVLLAAGRMRQGPRVFGRCEHVVRS